MLYGRPIKFGDLLAEIKKLASARVNIGTVFLIILAILVLVGASLIGRSILDITLSVVGFAVSVISLVIMIRISAEQGEVMSTQSEQLQSLDKLNDELRARKAERERVKALFLAPSGRHYTCIMPVEFRRRPLPTIAAGDYYAWHVVQNFVGDVQIGMKLTNRNLQDGDIVDESNGDAIFLCSPQANPPLAKLAPWLVLDDNSAVGPNESIGINLPIWFGSRKKKIFTSPEGKARDWEEKVICYLPIGGISALPIVVNALPSPAEGAYISTDALKDNQKPQRIPGSKPDLAIVIRASRHLFGGGHDQTTGEKIIVIAGIHQYGTWIAGDFLQRLCRGEKSEVARFFLSEADFAAVINGQFNEDTLSVDSSTVHGTDVWQFINNVWERAIKDETATGMSQDKR